MGQIKLKKKIVVNKSKKRKKKIKINKDKRLDELSYQEKRAIRRIL